MCANTCVNCITHATQKKSIYFYKVNTNKLIFYAVSEFIYFFIKKKQKLIFYGYRYPYIFLVGRDYIVGFSSNEIKL